MSHYAEIINWIEQHQVPCFIKSITHFDCPGCGLQTSFIQLLKGNVGNSFATYPALIPILILLSLLLLRFYKKLKISNNLLKYGYFFCATIILVSYIYKTINQH
jgi:hypothetical protein